MNQTLGKYVSNLDPSTLSLSLFSGKLTLKNLAVDCAAVNKVRDKC